MHIKVPRYAFIGGLVATFLFSLTSLNDAKIMGKSVTYSDKGFPLEGFLAYDDSLDDVRPGILIFPQSMGISRYERKRAEQLARLGYGVLVADVYGRGANPSNAAKASSMVKAFKSDRSLMRRRAQLALATLNRQKWTDTHLIGAIGYGFGGTTALELARSGAEIKGVISFYGDLDSPIPQDAKNIKSAILIIHGAEDTTVSWGQLEIFRHEMQHSICDWQVSVYGNSGHAFTEPPSKDRLGASGATYNRLTDGRSFRDMQRFFKEVLE